MNKLSTWLDTIGNAASRVQSLVNPARPSAPAVDVPAPVTDNKIYWIMGAVAAVLLVVLLVMRGKG